MTGTPVRAPLWTLGSVIRYAGWSTLIRGSELRVTPPSGAGAV